VNKRQVQTLSRQLVRYSPIKEVLLVGELSLDRYQALRLFEDLALLLTIIGYLIIKLALVLAISTTLPARILLVVGVLHLIQLDVRHVLDFVLLVKATPERAGFNTINNLGIREGVSSSILYVFHNLLE
jgi:hypothetical protein